MPCPWRSAPRRLRHISRNIELKHGSGRGVRALHNFLKYCETGKSAMIDKDEIEKKARSEGAAQEVRKHLNDLKLNRPAYGSRWIWELLQNARDAAAGKATSLTASVEHQEGELTFLHNGDGFTGNHVFYLIHHGSTKVGLKSTIGQFGSGFLTTHLLSSKIDVSGFLNDGQSFEFMLERKTGSIPSIAALLNKAWNDFKPSNKPLKVAMPPGFTTRFAYPISKEVSEVVAEGIANLKQCAPFVVVFNSEFSAINIRSATGTTSFKVMNRNPLEKAGMQLVTVSETENGIQQERKYLLATGEKSTVAFPLESVGSDNVCLSVDNTPRLFLGFPLVGTEKFSFPAIINSFKFNPTEPRNGIYLGQTNEQADIDNQKAVAEAFDLFIDLLGFAAASNLKNAHLLAEIPDIQKQNGLNSDWLRKVLMESLIPAIRRTPVVLSENGAIPPEESIVPFTGRETGDEGVEALWDLVNGLTELRQKLPSRNEAVGWCNAVESWSAILRDKVTDFPEVIDGAKLASYVEEKAKVTDEDYGRLSRLQTLLQQGESALIWLNRFCGFLKTNGFDEVLRIRSIILNQMGCLDKLSNLRRDQGISKTLKDIAESLEWNIREYLRDTKITALAEEIGAGDWNDDYVVRELIKQLQERADKNQRADKNPDAAFTEASERLFAWIVEQKKWDLLRGFPVFSNESPPAQRRVIKLDRAVDDALRPLAPVSAWPPKLQDFDKLFPSRYTLANAFSEAVSDKVWEVLEADGFVRRDVVITRKMQVDFNTFPPDEPLTDREHKTLEVVSITDVAFLTKDDIGIMARVRQSQRLARRFWEFLTEWLILRDSSGLEISEALCDCGETHRYYPAKWLIPVCDNKWVPFSAGGSTIARKADAQSLADLLRGGDWMPASLNHNPAAVKLLEAIGVMQFDLTRSFMASTDEERAEQEKEFTRILTSTDGDLKPVSEFAEDLKDDPELLDHLAKRRKNRQIVRDNQCLGKQVEKWVKEELEKKLKGGFTVRNTGVGSDFEIENLATLEINKSGRRWLVEVKATRNQEVRMTAAQAKTADRKGKRFFLCVVPVSGETTDLESDERRKAMRESMRFVQNIGRRVKPLCKALDGFKALRGDITAAASQGVRLEVETGAARVRIASSVWQDDGFTLSELPDRLN